HRWQQAVEAEVKSVFYDLLLLDAEKHVLLQADSMYRMFLEKTENRFAAGDIDALEQSTAATQRLQVQAQLDELLAEEEVHVNRLRYLLQIKERPVPLADTLLYHTVLAGADTTMIQ